jgi:site-specific DNA-cytosine methylase
MPKGIQGNQKNMNYCKYCKKRIEKRVATAQFCSDKCRVYWHRSRNKFVTAAQKPEKAIILSLCDFSGNWSQPYQESGEHEVIRIDIKLGKDLRLLHFPGKIHGILAAPPCTMFSLAGNRHHRSDADLIEALSVVDACLRLVATTEPAWWALENPRGKLSHYLGKPSWTFQPYQYGAKHSKFTCLWGKFNPPQYNPTTPEFSLNERNRSPALRATTPIEFAYAFFVANP